MDIIFRMNINDNVWVELTSHGFDTLKAHYYKLPQVFSKPEERHRTGKYFSFQLHELMHIFGPDSFVGSANHFVDNVVYFTKP